ncbi:MAG: TrkA family potassium uptake protein [Actinomycetota bacterium]
MYVVIAGCGRVGSDLAVALSDVGHDVAVIDESPQNLEKLGELFDGTTEVGLAYDLKVLRAAGIENADVFVAVTGTDNANVMAVQVAKKVFGVPKTIARLDDPGRADVYKALGVSYVAAAHLVSKVMYEQVVEPEFVYHLTFSGGDIEIVEMRLGAGAEAVLVSSFEIDGDLRVSAVRRNGHTFIPGPDTELRQGDMVVAAAKHGIAGKVKKFLRDESGFE